MEQSPERVIRLQSALRDAGADGAVIGATDHMRYLVGWTEPPGERFMVLWVPASGEPVLIVPALYSDDARRAVTTVAITSWHDNAGWHAGVEPLLSALLRGGTVLVDDDLGAGHLMDLQSLAPSVSWRSCRAVMAALRGIKDQDELRAMERSAAMADRVYDRTLAALRPGITELELQQAILKEFVAEGASSAWAIVCFGPNTALPHHRTGATQLVAGSMVILDLGGCLDGYQSDITRTVAYGQIGDEAARIYDIVYEAHVAAMEAARPGVTCESVDAAARNTIAQAGYGPNFIHRTGHGIGLSTHEPPNLVEGDRTVLQPGMCFSDEPGIYLSGRFGVRIENIITITGTGSRSLNHPPPSRLPVLE